MLDTSFRAPNRLLVFLRSAKKPLLLQHRSQFVPAWQSQHIFLTSVVISCSSFGCANKPALPPLFHCSWKTIKLDNAIQDMTIQIFCFCQLALFWLKFWHGEFLDEFSAGWVDSFNHLGGTLPDLSEWMHGDQPWRTMKMWSFWVRQSRKKKEINKMVVTTPNCQVIHTICVRMGLFYISTFLGKTSSSCQAAALSNSGLFSP